MTVSSSVRRAGPFLGNGSVDTFPFEFKIFDKTDVLVTHTDLNGVETELVLDSDYTVNANPDQDESPGGTVTYPISGALLPDGEKVTLSGALSYDQPTDITNQGGFYPEVVEDALDRSAIQNQQLKEKLDRAVVVPISDERTPADYWQDLFVAADAAAQSATASAAAAASSEQAAASSEQAAALSESNAAGSASAAATSEGNAAGSASAAAASAAAASSSEGAAALSESNSAASESAAAQSATNAANSAASILDAEANSAASAAAASASETAALASENAAAGSAAAAATSAATVDAQGLSTQHYGDIEPTTTWPGMPWAHKSAGVLKRRNDDDTDWVIERPLFEDVSLGRLIGVQVFTASDTYTPTEGTTSIVAEVVSGGGAGAGTRATAGSQISTAHGGWSGSYAKGRFTSGFSGVPVTVGAGGTPVTGNHGNPGGSSSLGALISCPGGPGGIAYGPTTPPHISNSGGSSVLPSGGNICAVACRPAKPSMSLANTAGQHGGEGGSSVLGAGGKDNQGGVSGHDATGPGGGGAGTAAPQAWAAMAGGKGKDGLVIIWEYA